MRKQLKRFNSSVEILQQMDYSALSRFTWENVSDVNSDIYSINFPNEDDVPLCVKRSAVDAQTLIARCCEEVQYLDTEMSNTINTYFSQCLELESRLSTVASRQEFKDSNILLGIFSVIAKQLYDERVHLSVACNMFENFLTLPLEVTNYMVEHTKEVDVCNTWDADEDVESDEDVDSEL